MSHMSNMASSAVATATGAAASNLASFATGMSMPMASGAATAAAAAATTSMSHSDMNMGGMDMSHGGSSDGMSMMPMTFFTSNATPLYSLAWTPYSDGSYAGTCIFLVVLALLLRCLMALKSILEMYVWQSAFAAAAAGGSWHGLPGESNQHHHQGAGGDEAKGMQVGEGVAEARGGLLRRVRLGTPPWRLKVDGVRAVLDVIVVGVGYLL